MPPRARSGPSSAEPTQTVEQIAAALEAFLAEHAKSVVVEDGKVLFDMRTAKYSLATEHGRCTLQVWSEERNVVRRVRGAVERGGPRDRVLRLAVQRFGQTRPSSLELLADPDRRTPTTREATRLRYLRALERVMLRGPGVSRDHGESDRQIDLLLVGSCSGGTGRGIPMASQPDNPPWNRSRILLHHTDASPQEPCIKRAT